MINHDEKIIFVHIPKCACCSINRALDLKIHGGTGHAYYKGHKKFIDQGYFCFSFVRNPWDRVVSLYHYFLNMKPGHQWYGQNKKLANYVKDLSFDQFCKQLDEFQKSPASGVHFVPAYKFLVDTSNKINLDYIGRFENMQRDFEIVCDKAGISALELPHINKSNHNQYVDYYCNETKDIVDSRYEQDIEYFKYKYF